MVFRFSIDSTRLLTTWESRDFSIFLIARLAELRGTLASSRVGGFLEIERRLVLKIKDLSVLFTGRSVSSFISLVIFLSVMAADRPGGVSESFFFNPVRDLFVFNLFDAKGLTLFFFTVFKSS